MQDLSIFDSKLTPVSDSFAWPRS